MKILADVEIIKNLKTINKKYHENQKNRSVSDKEIINSFKNEVNVPVWVINNKMNSLFNNFLKTITKITRQIL